MAMECGNAKPKIFVIIFTNIYSLKSNKKYLLMYLYDSFINSNIVVHRSLIPITVFGYG